MGAVLVNVFCVLEEMSAFMPSNLLEWNSIFKILYHLPTAFLCFSIDDNGVNKPTTPKPGQVCQPSLAKMTQLFPSVVGDNLLLLLLLA